METPSFVGIAYIDENFVYRYANGQFFKILDVTPAQIIGQTMQDSTPPNLRRLEEANANLMKQGLQDFYTMEKTFAFVDGKQKNVVLTKCRVPTSKKGSFQFFIVQIIEGEEIPTVKTPMPLQSEYPMHPPSSGKSGVSEVIDFIGEYYKLLVVIGTGIGAFVLTVMGALK